MVLFFTTTLLLSSLGMMAILMVKRWELRTNRMVLGKARPALGNVFHAATEWSERVLPALLTRAGHQAIGMVSSLLHRAVAWSILSTERLLEHSLWRLRHTTAPQAKENNVSHFLREVAEHKKQLARGSEGIE